MSGGFAKRIKKGTGSDLLATLPADEGTDVAPLPVTAKSFEFKRNIEVKSKSPLDKRFAEIGKADRPLTTQLADLPVPKSIVRQPQQNPTKEDAPNPKALSFLEANDPEAKYLRQVVQNGQRIIEDYAQRPIWSTGIIEVKTELSERLEHSKACNRAFKDKLDNIIRSKLFPRPKLLIPEVDTIAKGDIFVVPKYTREGAEELSTQEQLRRFLEGNKKHGNR